MIKIEKQKPKTDQEANLELWERETDQNGNRVREIIKKETLRLALRGGGEMSVNI